MTAFFTTVLYNPLLNTLIFFYNTIAFQDFGVAIIFFTIFIRLILFPIYQKSAEHQATMQRLQPHLKKIEEKHKGDLESKGRATMELYREHNFNPFFGLIFFIIQIPILIALYRIFLNSTKPDFLVYGLYSFIARPASIHASFLGLINLGERNILLVGLAAFAQYIQARLTLPRREAGHTPTAEERMVRQMALLSPAITFAIFFNFPAAVSLYWLVATLFSIGQQLIINQHGTARNLRNEPH